MDSISSIDRHRMHCIPLPQFFSSTYNPQSYFRLKELDKLMHYMVPCLFIHTTL